VCQTEALTLDRLLRKQWAAEAVMTFAGLLLSFMPDTLTEATAWAIEYARYQYDLYECPSWLPEEYRKGKDQVGG
jgi:hypothetical protein